MPLNSQNATFKLSISLKYSLNTMVCPVLQVDLLQYFQELTEITAKLGYYDDIHTSPLSYVLRGGMKIF